MIKIVTLLAVVTSLAHCKTHFAKDMHTDAVFPPENIQTVAGIPEGHLRPLGYQKKPDGKVREEKDPITAPTFYMRYIKNDRPVVIRGAIKRATVLEKWEDDEYLNERYGDVNVTITVKKEVTNRAPERTRRRLLMKKFLLDYMYENWYLSNTVHDRLRAELPLPDVLSCGTFKERLTETEMWMSSGGTASLLHSHGDHNIHCVIDGRKDFILIEKQQKTVFKFEETYPNSGSGQSPMDMDMINVYKNPKISHTPWEWSTLWQGDCIYIPAGYLHQVRSFGRGISYTIQFAPSLTFESLDCKDDTKVKRKKDKRSKPDNKEDASVQRLSLSDVEFIWTYQDGHRYLSDQKLVPGTLRRVLLLLLRDSDQLHKTQFEHFYQDVVGEKVSADRVFHAMTPNDNREYISRDEINAISTNRLQSVCDALNNVKARLRDEL